MITTEPYALLNELTYLLDEGFPAPVIEAMLVLASDYSRSHNRYSALQAAHEAWKAWDERDDSDFDAAVQEMTGEECLVCSDCATIVWSDETTTIANGSRVCDDGCLEEYTCCDDCNDYFATDNTTSVGDERFCDRRCLGRNCHRCDDCEEWVHDDDNDHFHESDDDDESGCDCVAPHLRFEFPNDGHGTVSENERVTVELPKGTIDEEGIRRITTLVQDSIGTVNDSMALEARRAARDIFWQIPQLVQDVGPLWQAKRGNFTRRLSAALYTAHHIKLPEGVISEVGNLARAHSSDSADWLIEFTRDLNGSASAFYHEDSCWFTGGTYGRSRCALKNWGGVALRTYENGSNRHHPDGRAWVQPLNGDLEPSHDTVGARAYVVYNGYGSLEGYVAARIVAHLTSLSYRKIGYYAHPQYVNGDTGYLVADEATCAATESITLDYPEHHTTDASSVTYQKAVA